MISPQQRELTVSQWQLCLPFDTLKHLPETKENWEILTTEKECSHDKKGTQSKLSQISRVCFIRLSVPLQGLPEDCVRVLVEPDGPHLRYSAEAVEQGGVTVDPERNLPLPPTRAPMHTNTTDNRRAGGLVSSEIGFKFSLFVTSFV